MTNKYQKKAILKKAVVDGKGGCGKKDGKGGRPVLPSKVGIGMGKGQGLINRTWPDGPVKGQTIIRKIQEFQKPKPKLLEIEKMPIKPWKSPKLPNLIKPLNTPDSRKSQRRRLIKTMLA